MPKIEKSILLTIIVKKKPLEKRICKCGIEFEATRNNKIHCSRKCKDKYRKPQYIKKIGEKPMKKMN